MTATTPILDNFNRANVGPPPSSSWTNLNAGLKVVSNVCAANAANSVEYWNPGTFGPDAEAYCTITTKPGAGNSVGVYIRLKDVGSIATVDGYALFGVAVGGTDTFQIQRVDNAVATTLGASISQEFAANDTMLLRGVGSTLEFEYNGTSVTTRTDSTYGAAGYIGAAITDTTGRLDDFGGGTYIAPSGLAIPVAMAQYRQRGL